MLAARGLDERRAALAVVAGLTLLALVLRIAAIGQSLWGDELFLYEIVHDRSLGEAMSVVYRTESTPPLYFVVAWFSTQVGGDDVLWMRLPSLVFATATVPLLHLLGERTVGRRAGLVAAAMFAVVPFDVFYGTEGRTYAAEVLFVVAAALCVLEVVRSDRRRWVVLLALAVAGAAYSHYTVVFVLIALVAWVAVFHRPRLGRVLIAYAGALVLYAPWIPGALHQFQDNTSDRFKDLGILSGPGDFVEVLVRIVAGHPFTGLRQVPGVLALCLIAAALVVGAVGLRRARPTASTWLVVALAAVTPVCAAIYQLTGSSIFGSRYLIGSLPGLLLVCAAFVTAPPRRALAAAATALLVAGVGISAVRGLQDDSRRPPYDTVARMLDDRVPASVPVVEPSFSADPPGRVLGYLMRKPHAYFPVGRPLDDLYRQGRRAGRIVVVAPSASGPLIALYGFEQRGFRLTGRRRFPGFFPLDVLSYEPA